MGEADENRYRITARIMCESYGRTGSMRHKQHYVSPIAQNAAARLRFLELDVSPAKMPGGWDGSTNGNQTAREWARYMRDKL